MRRNGTPSTVASCLLLGIVTLALYAPVRSHPFINFDDEGYVTNNLHVRAGFTWKTFAWAWTATEQYNWHPITWLSHALDCQVYGLNPSGHHFTSLLLHVLNVVLVFLLLRWGTGRPGASLLVAALFALHPFNVESVAWIAERKNLLSTLFFLLAIGAYGWYASKPNARRYGLVVILFALGLAAKPMVITLPFVLLLLDYWPLERIQGWELQQTSSPPPNLKSGRERKAMARESAARGGLLVKPEPFFQLVLEKVPLLAIAAASAVITVVAQKSGGAVRSLTRFPFRMRLENSLYSYAMYAWKMLWPQQFALYYPHPLSGLVVWRVLLAILFLIAVSGLAWQQRTRHKYLVTGWLWYLGTLVPVIGIVQVGDQAMADRYAYIPMTGFLVMLVWGIVDLAENAGVNSVVCVGAAIIVLAALSFVTRRQLGYWQSSVGIWSHTQEISKPNPLIEGELADALHSADRPQDALPHFQNAVAMQPRDAIRRVDLAEDMAECGELAEAAEQYESAIALSSSDKLRSQSYESLAILYGELSDYAKARDRYRQAVSLNPKLESEMVARAQQFVSSNPSGDTYLFLGMILREDGQATAARAAFEQATTLNPELKATRQFLEDSTSSPP